MINPPAEILPPQLRRDLIQAGLKKDMAEIDEIHALARQNYPELFQPQDDLMGWGKREARGTKKR